MIYNSSGRLKKIIILESGSKSPLETISQDDNFTQSIALNQQDFDPSLGPTGQPLEDVPESTTGPGGSLQESQGPAPSMANEPPVVSEQDESNDMDRNFDFLGSLVLFQRRWKC